ncbi:MAG TPA: MoxR family ATPase, partial [Beutenbergiaceae bacterium]|nr:MoxR family ATPase [Beutenbergiaceae bacterium]
TSNRTRDVHDALKRRCYYHWLPHPELNREIEIVRSRVPQATTAVAEGVARIVGALREVDLLKPPGVSESIDWAATLVAIGASEITVEVAARTLGAVLKYHEDLEAVMPRLDQLVAQPA